MRLSEMFSVCKDLKSINLPKFNTYNVTQMNKMLYKSSALTSLDITNFNAGNVTTMENTLTQCSSLTSLNWENFGTGEAHNMAEMFRKFTDLTDLNKFVVVEVILWKYVYGMQFIKINLKICPKFFFIENSVWEWIKIVK